MKVANGAPTRSLAAAERSGSRSSAARISAVKPTEIIGGGMSPGSRIARRLA